jgi:hypothetical protein
MMGKRLRAFAPPVLTLTLTLALALALLAGLATAGEAKTPLGKWMKPNMGGALAGQDFATLQKSFDVIAAKPPSGDYPQWVTLSKNGSAASAKQDLGGVKASCKGCHDAYKTKYQNEFPNRPFP